MDFLDQSIYPRTTDARWGNHLHCTAEIHSHSQIFWYGRSIFCLPHRPKSSGFFDLCLHWVSVVRAYIHVYYTKFIKEISLIELINLINSSWNLKFSYISRWSPLYMNKEKWKRHGNKVAITIYCGLQRNWIFLDQNTFIWNGRY